MILCGKEEGNVCIIRPVRQDHINKGGTGGVAQLIELIEHITILRCRSAAFHEGRYPVCIYDFCAGTGSNRPFVGILLKKSIIEAFMADKADEQRENDEEKYDSDDTFYGNVIFKCPV